MTPDPAFLYLTRQHREALAGLSYAIVERKGFLVLSGVAGCGKTTLLAWVLGRLPTAQVQSSIILNPMLKPDEFLEMAMLDFGITEIPESKARRLWMLQNYLMQGQRDGKINVLIVDEAHKLSPGLMEEVRLLGNLEHGTDKLLQILLIGQPELDDVISRPELWQFKQRINVRVSLEALSEEEVDRYIEHRWRVAGGKEPAPFSLEARAAVAKRSTGIPRLVNSLCDNALTMAFADESRTITAEHIETAARDLRLIPKAPAAAPVVMMPASHAEPPDAHAAAVRSSPALVVKNGTAPANKPKLADGDEPILTTPISAKRSWLARWFGLATNGNGRH
ncbi:MAG TPA: AAA family ATPase [Bryobacteraceae bacterium]|nr:AAA family ATPase [Bryobacteraceae bacterium]